MSGQTKIAFILGSFIRLALFYFGFSGTFQKRVEVSTPLNSWINVQEGLYLKSKNITAYDGDTFHETPLMLHFAEFLSGLPAHWLFGIFILCDLISAINLSAFANEAKAFYLSQRTQTSKFVKESKDLEITEDENCGEYVFTCYLLSPFTIMSCVALTTTTFGNLIISVAILGLIKGYRLISCAALGLAMSQSLYPVVLIFPAILSIHDKEVAAATALQSKIPGLFLSATKTICCFMLTIGGILYVSHFLTNGTLFLERIYGFILSAPDLKPNIGLFWYFFTEMFEHFHMLFICTFQINAFIYILPLAIRFHNEPALLVYAYTAIISIFKSYPAVGDLGFYLALLPMWKHLAPFMQQKFIVACFFIATTVLAPVQWYLWIYSGSANANFYFGVTIALGTAQIFLLTDVLLSYLKREYYLDHGMVKEVDGIPARLALH